MSADADGWMDGRLTCDTYAVFDWLYMRVSGYGSSIATERKLKRADQTGYNQLETDEI